MARVAKIVYKAHKKIMHANLLTKHTKFIPAMSHEIHSVAPQLQCIQVLQLQEWTKLKTTKKDTNNN